MATAPGRATDAVAFLREVAAAPYRYDFYQALRHLECLLADHPRWGEALRPADEPVRLGQDADLAFAPAALAAVEFPSSSVRPRLQVRLFGLLGPNGPLPIHLTEYVRERVRAHGDRALSRFLDLLNHRFAALFYRAWAQAQPHVNRDRPGADRFSDYVGALIGIAPPAMRQRDALADVAKLFHAGLLVRHVRNAEGVKQILAAFFGVPVAIEEFVGAWLVLGPAERTHLGQEGAVLGRGAVAGGRVWSRQHKFRVVLGPLTLEAYESFLPGGTPLRMLVDWIRLYLSFELDWDVRLRLRRDEVPGVRVGAAGRLGWTTWIGTRPTDADADDLCLHAERFVRSARGHVA